MSLYSAAEDERYLAALKRWGTHEPITMTIPALEYWILFAQLQLALRHPSHRGNEASKLARAIGREMQTAFKDDPDLLQLAERGWYSEFDAPRLPQAPRPPQQRGQRQTRPPQRPNKRR